MTLNGRFGKIDGFDDERKNVGEMTKVVGAVR